MQRQRLWHKLFYGFCLLIITTISTIVPVSASTDFVTAKWVNDPIVMYGCKQQGVVEAIFWTMRADGTQVAQTQHILDDAVVGFADGTPVWHLNQGLSLFFQIPIYERDTLSEISGNGCSSV